MTRPDPTLLVDVVSAKVLDALKLASEALTLAQVRHVVVGGLAVGANGYPRATRDVDFLVGAEAFHHHASGLLLSPETHEPFLEATLSAPPGSMMEAAPLVYMKLKSPRRKDHVDVIEMIKGGIDTTDCRAYLAAHAPAFVPAFDECVGRAEAEED
jgi:hypothetical protein